MIGRLRPNWRKVPGAPTYLQAIQDLRNRWAGQQCAISIYAAEHGSRGTQHLGAKGGEQVADVSGDCGCEQRSAGSGQQSLTFVFDRTTASRLGFDPQLIDDTLYDAFGQRQVSIMYTPLNQYHVVMEVAPQYWQNPSAFHEIYVRSPSGAPGAA